MQGWRRPARTGAWTSAAAVLSGCTGEAGPWLFGSLALVLAAAGGAGIGWLLARQRSRHELHDARQEARLLARLAGGRIWRRMPDGPPIEADWLAPQLRPGEPLPAVVQGDDPPLEWRAEAWFEADGRSAGHLGLVRELVQDGAAGHALTALVQALPMPLAVLARHDGTEAWRILQASPAARTRLGDANRLAPDAVQAALPAGLRAPWAAGAAEAEAEGWQLRRRAGPGHELCLLWQAEGASADEQASFSYTVSHDLRAPIRVVEGFTRIVKEDYGPGLDRIANDHLDRVLGAAARMNQMIDAMLTLARLSTQPLARQPVNLSQLAGYVVDDLRRSAPERPASIEIEAGMTTLGDPTLLRLVLENLLGNAWKYSARRAQTHITFRRETVDGRSAYVVRDNGAGFDMRSAERLFGLFQRLHSASDFAGTGVGLASVRRIVQRHGGEIWADGEPGRGAAFFFTLRV